MQTIDIEKQHELMQELKALGLQIFGFGYVGDCDFPKKKGLPYAISIGLPLTPAVVENIRSGPNQVYYDEYLTLNDELDRLTSHIQQKVEQLGYRAYAVLSSKRTDFVHIAGEFPHKTAAVRSGLGWIGKSALLITKQFGPRLRISTVLTDMPLQTDEAIPAPRCGQCRNCTDSCPSQAIAGNTWSETAVREDLVDVHKCDQWKIKNFPEYDGLVCGICVAVCPHGRRAFKA